MKQAKFTFLLLLFCAAQTFAQTITDITGPAGSGEFGKTITVLPNGNYLVTDPLYDEGANLDVGAVYLYNGRTRNLISTLKGSTAGDRIGSSGITILTNGNYLVHSPNWHNGSAADAGAVTWCSRTKGVAGVISSINSLVGSTANDQVGNVVIFNGVIVTGITVLSNGNYVVGSSNWDNGSATDAGAATWGNGTTGVVGIISSTNSLVGSTTRDIVGINVRELSNGNYIVISRDWSNGSILTAQGFGAVTWGSGTTGIKGVISSANSLIGSSQIDRVGSGGVMILSNGNYLVISPFWNDLVTGNVNAGAVTWGSGTTGVSGIISSSNSLIGSSPGENLGNSLGDSYVTQLSNGNYVVSSPRWGNGAGAVTWGSGTTGISGFASISNSLVGSTANDRVGSGLVTVLSNGNYVVGSRDWDNGAAIDAGAVTWGSGTTGVVGFVSSSNSLVGSQINDRVGLGGITALKNGNYVVRSLFWDNGAATDAAAITWGNGATGITGEVSSGNSLVGNSAGDLIGNGRMTVLTNGNYVISSPDWDNGAALNAGAVTWVNGTTGISGVVSSSNSLVGITANDRVGGGYNWGGQGGGNGIVTLSNGNYLVRSSNWNNGAASNAGAVTWCNGTTGITGEVSSSNSLVGGLAGDLIGSNGVTPLANGNYVVSSPNCDNEHRVDAGAVTWGNGTTGITGLVSNTNSLVGNSGHEFVGNGGVTALPNGNYVVVSLNYGMAPNSGAVTWGNGITGVVGGVSNLNSLLGGRSNDQAGSGGITILSNGNYVVHTPSWDHGNTVADAGAVTWGNGATGVVGNISSSNSLVGNSTGDRIGNGGITALSDGNFAVKSPNFDNAATIDAGAVTLVNGAEGIDDIITRCNSVIGNLTSGGASLNFAYNDTYDYLIGGRPLDNTVSTNTLKGRARPLAVTLDNSVTTITGFITSQLIASAGCRIIARHRPQGLNQIRGTLSAKVWIENAVPNQSGQPFAARHYELMPDANPSTTTGRITLYFTQAEFDDFNADAASIADLPSRENDNAGKANLRIIKYAGTSSDGSGLPASYPGETETINPNDDNIEWNDNQNRWEVTFNVTGFGGFIVQTAVDAITSRQMPSPENNKLALYPNPAIDAATLSIGNKKLLNTMAVLTDMQGRQVKQFVINNYLEQIDISKLPKGMYILKLADGKALKLTKN